MQSDSVRQDFSRRAPLVQKAPTTLCRTEWSSPATARPCRALEYLPRSLEIDDLHCPVVSRPSRARRRPVQVTALTGHSRSSSPSRAEARTPPLLSNPRLSISPSAGARAATSSASLKPSHSAIPPSPLLICTESTKASRPGRFRLPTEFVRTREPYSNPPRLWLLH